MNLKDTFFPLGDKPHLYVVVHREPNHCISVNFTTKREGCDLSCIAQAGEHPFLTRESVIRYDGTIEWVREKTIVEDARYLIQGIRDPISDELLERIRRGGLISRYASGRLKQIFRAALAPPR